MRMRSNALGLAVCSLLFPVVLLGQNNTGGNGNGSSSSTASPAHSSSAAVATNYVFPTKRQVIRFGYRGVAGVRALFGSAFHASWDTWVTETPEEWGDGASGWGKRFGASVADNAINQTTLVALSLATHRDPIYYRCACTGIGHRSLHAVKMTFESRDRNGNGRFSIPDLVSPFVGPVITRNTIYPSRYNTQDGLRAGGYYLLGTVGWNLVREFVLKGPKW